MTKLNKLMALVLSLVLVFSLAACGGTTTEEAPAPDAEADGAEETPVADPIELRCSTNLAATSTVGQGLAYFVEELNTRSEGRIQAVANYGAEMGNQAEQVEMAYTGSLEMVVANNGTGMSTWVPELEMTDFAYLYDSNEQYRFVLKYIEDAVNEKLADYGFISMAGQSQGIRQMLTVTPVEDLSGMTGMTMRGPNATYAAMLEALGASATTLDWNECYTALQTGVIDGMEGSISSLHASALHEVATHVTMSNHACANVYYFFNAEWFNALPEDLQTLVRETAADAALKQAELDDASNDVAKQEMLDAGVTFYELADIDQWKSSMDTLKAENYAKSPEYAEFMDLLDEAVAAYEG